MIRRLFHFFIAFLLLNGPAFAEEVCYGFVENPATMDCTNKYGAGSMGKLTASGADFAGTCDEGGTVLTPVEIECPSKGKWVSTGSYSAHFDIPSATEVCAKVGLKPSSLDGKVCASGERRPTSGGDWEFIRYVWGTKGSRTKGGDRVQQVYYTPTCRDCGTTSEPQLLGTFCYDHQMGDKNNTKEDRLIAFYCDE